MHDTANSTGLRLAALATMFLASCSALEDPPDPVAVGEKPGGKIVVGPSTDVDDDGFMSMGSGGTDCVDQQISVFIETTPPCDPTAPPVFLDSELHIADHTWVRDPFGTFHMFYQGGTSAIEIQHMVSIDLQSVTPAGTALPVNPLGFDSFGVWAPHIVEVDGTYYMFYTGVTGPGSDPNAQQRIGLATSTDLVNWTRYPMNNCPGSSGDGCVYDCDEKWTSWGNGGAYDAQCRDPFVIWDKENRNWVMFTTVRLDWSGPWSHGVSVATSPDLINWSGQGYIRSTARLTSGMGGVDGQLTGGEAENPFVMEYEGTHYLMFTDWADPEDNWDVPNPRTRVQYVGSVSLEADSTGSLNWLYSGYIPDPGVNAIEVMVVEGDTWLMSQSISNVNSGDLDLHWRDLRMKRIEWTPDGGFTTSNLTNLECRVPSAKINPARPDICGDGIDNDCNGLIDDGPQCLGPPSLGHRQRIDWWNGTRRRVKG